MAAAVEELKAVYSELPSYDAIVPHLLRTNVAGARAACHLVPGVPVTPMLAKPSKGIGEVLTRFEGQTFTCEWKYDGERAQVVSTRRLARARARVRALARTRTRARTRTGLRARARARMRSERDAHALARPPRPAFPPSCVARAARAG